MKKITRFIFLLLVVTMVVTSCSKPEPATITELPITEQAEEVLSFGGYGAEPTEIIPVRISEDNELVNPTCIPEYQYLEKIYYHIGEKLDNGEYEFGVWKAYCEQGIYPKLSFNVKILEVNGKEPQDWVYNLNQPNIVRPWVKPLYSLLFQETETIYSLNLGKTYKATVVSKDSYGGSWFWIHPYILAENLFYGDDGNKAYQFIEQQEEIRLFIHPVETIEEFFWPSVHAQEYLPYFVADMSIERGFFPLIEYESNYLQPSDDIDIVIGVSVDRGIEAPSYYAQLYELRFKPKLIQDSSWSKPRWVVDLREYYGKPVIVPRLRFERFYNIYPGLTDQGVSNLLEERRAMACMSPEEFYHWRPYVSYTEMLTPETDYMVLTDSYGQQVYIGPRDRVEISLPSNYNGWVEKHKDKFIEFSVDFPLKRISIKHPARKELFSYLWEITERIVLFNNN